MKKIMFSDKYGLTQAVLERRKTMTRRVVSESLLQQAEAYRHEFYNYTLDALPLEDALLEFSPFKIGDVVAVAQRYKDAGLDPKNCDKFQHVVYGGNPPRNNHGWSNKMFVRADLMPHQIRITNIRVERLQNISDEDCKKEGIQFSATGGHYVNYNPVTGSRIWLNGETYRASFVALIDKISGKGTWESNPYVFVYEFELVKRSRSFRHVL